MKIQRHHTEPQTPTPPRTKRALATAAAIGALTLSLLSPAAAFAAPAPEASYLTTGTLGDAHCVDGGAVADVSISVSPADAGVPTYVTRGTDGSFEDLGGLTGTDGTFATSVPIAKSGITSVAVGRITPDGESVYAGDRDYTFPAECAVTPTPTPEPTPTASVTPSPTPSASPTAELVTASVSLSRTRVATGGQVTVTASGLHADEGVEIWLHSTPVRLWSGAADQSGGLSETVTVPANAPLGAHQIEVRGATTGSLWLDLNVTNELAATGTDGSLNVGVALGAGLLLAGGSAIWLVARRRLSQ